MKKDIKIGDIMLHDGYPIDKEGDMVGVRIQEFIEGKDLVKCSFFDEHFTNFVADRNKLFEVQYRNR